MPPNDAVGLLAGVILILVKGRGTDFACGPLYDFSGYRPGTWPRPVVSVDATLPVCSVLGTILPAPQSSFDPLRPGWARSYRGGRASILRFRRFRFSERDTCWTWRFN